MIFFRDINDNILVFNLFAEKTEQNLLIANVNKLIGLYFLIENKEIVYVGRSTNIARRLKEQNKQYTAIGIIKTSDHIIQEKYFIELLNPKYNKIR